MKRVATNFNKFLNSDTCREYFTLKTNNFNSMKFLFTIIFIGITILSSAQFGVKTLWQKDFAKNAGPSEIEYKGVKAIPTGAFVGGMQSTGDGLFMSAAFYSTTGTLMWDTIIKTVDRAWVNFVDADAQGNFYMGGVETIGGNYNARQVHIVKIDESGNVIWHQVYAGNNSEADLFSMKVVGNHIYLCGDQNSTKYAIAWLGKYDLDGNQVWVKTFDPGGEAYFNDVTIDGSGNVTTAGAADYGERYLAVQYNSSGNKNWEYPSVLTGDFEQYYTGLTHDSIGNIYMAGTEEAGSSFDFDITTTKLNSSGELVWSKSFPTGDGYSSEIRIGPDGNIHTFATTEENYDDFATALKYDVSGTLLWDTKYSIDGSSSGMGGRIDNNGNIYMSASEYNSVGFVKLNPSGKVIAKQTYSSDIIKNIYDYSIEGNALIIAGASYNPSQGKIISLQTEDFTENYNQSASGEKLKILTPYAITSDANSSWFSAGTKDEDTSDYYVTKLDNSGNVVWQAKDTYPGGFSGFSYLEHDGSGNVVGFYSNQKTAGEYTSSLVKYDVLGNQLYKVMLDSAGAYEARGLAIATNGEIFISGLNTKEKKMFVSKYTSTGTRTWRKFYQSPYASFPVSVPLGMKISPQGKIVILAYHRGTNNVNDLHIFQYADDGTLEWHKDVDNAAGNLVSLDGFEIESNGDIVVFGKSGGTFYVLKKYDSSGNEKWSERKILASRTDSRSMAIDDLGNVYTGFSTPSSLIIRKHDANGNFLLQKSHSFTSPGSFFYPQALVAMNNQIVVLGQHYISTTAIPFEMLLDDQLNEVSNTIQYNTEYANFTDYSVDGAGNIYELWQTPTYKGAYIYYSGVKKMALNPVGISNVELLNNIIHLYPNPAYDQLHLRTEENGEFRVYNVRGQLVLNKQITSTHNSIDIQEIKPGVYIWRMNNNQGKLIIK